MKNTVIILTSLSATVAIAMSKNADTTRTNRTIETTTSASGYTPPTAADELSKPTHSEFPDADSTRRQGLYPRDSQGQTSRNQEMPMDDNSDTTERNMNPRPSSPAPAPPTTPTPRNTETMSP